MSVEKKICLVQKRLCPKSFSQVPGTPIIMLTMHQSNQLVEEAKKLGVKGYVNKSQASQALLQAIDAVLNDQIFYPAALTATPEAEVNEICLLSKEVNSPAVLASRE
jgi:DNA-binding NarL/FixJ family response regulator